jgi:hypothetical protein
MNESLELYAINKAILDQLQVISVYQELAKQDCRNSKYSKTLIELTKTLGWLLQFKESLTNKVEEVKTNDYNPSSL